MSLLLRSVLLGATVAAVLAPSALPSDASRSSVASEPLAVSQGPIYYTLGRVDPATLSPTGKQVELYQTGTPVLSPARRWVAFSGGPFHGISVASTAPLRPPRRLIPLPRGHMLALAWPKAHRLLALAGRDSRYPAACCRTLRLYVVDPLQRRVLRRVRLPRGLVIAVKPTRSGLAILLGGYGKLASARLLLVTGSGAVRTVALSRFRVGATKLGKNGAFLTVAALTVGPGSAYVVGRSKAGPAVAVVPLTGGHASYHTLPVDPELFTPDQALVLLPGGRLGIASVAGLYVYDTHTWQKVGSVPFQAKAGFISGDTMVVLDDGSGMDVYNLDGSLRYHVDTSAQVDSAFFVGGRAFLAYQGGDSWSALDLETGTLQAPVYGGVPELIPGQPGVPAFAWTL